jgi:hypothetical protein
MPGVLAGRERMGDTRRVESTREALCGMIDYHGTGFSENAQFTFSAGTEQVHDAAEL